MKLWWGCVLVAGCSSTRLTQAEMRDPSACADCHPDHHLMWSGSMHAYAGEDPVFIALNAQGQQETGGELGDFCVQCHAPVAVELGLTTDGLNLDELPDDVKGITCYFCHQVDAVEGEHNNPLRMAQDRVLRAGIDDPVPTAAHASAYSPLHDRTQDESSDLCGSCHDIVTPAGVHIERTFTEWQSGIFSQPLVGLRCGGCHMPGREGLAAEADGVELRRVHDHRFVGVDLAVTPFPEAEDQRAEVQDFLDDSVLANLCVQPSEGSTTPVVVSLDNVAAGHAFPSGATSDRRVWVQLDAYAGDTLVWSSGAVQDGQSLPDYLAQATEDVWTLHSTLLDADGQPTHKFWEAADIDFGAPDPLQVHNTLDPTDPAYVRTVQFRNYLVRGEGIDRIRMQVRMRPLPLDLVDELIAEGWLDADVREQLPTFTLGATVLEWTPAVPVNSGNLACVPEPPPRL